MGDQIVAYNHVWEGFQHIPSACTDPVSYPCWDRLVVTSTVFTSSMPPPSTAPSGVVTTTTSSMWTLTSGVAIVAGAGEPSVTSCLWRNEGKPRVKRSPC